MDLGLLLKQLILLCWQEEENTRFIGTTWWASPHSLKGKTHGEAICTICAFVDASNDPTFPRFMNTKKQQFVQFLFVDANDASKIDEL